MRILDRSGMLKAIDTLGLFEDIDSLCRIKRFYISSRFYCTDRVFMAHEIRLFGIQWVDFYYDETTSTWEYYTSCIDPQAVSEITYKNHQDYQWVNNHFKEINR